MCTHEKCRGAVTDTGPELGLRVCARCKTVAYCSKLCQKAHWKLIHKQECKETLIEKLSNIQNGLFTNLLSTLWSKGNFQTIVEMKLEISEVACIMREYNKRQSARMYAQLGSSLACIVGENDKTKCSYIVRENDDTISAVGNDEQLESTFDKHTYNEEAFDNLKKSPIYEEMYKGAQTPENIECLCDLLGDTATLYRDNFLFDNAISLHERALCVAGEKKINEVVCRTKSQLGELYYFIGDNEKAHVMLKESEEIALSIGDPYAIAGTKMGLAGWYEHVGEYEKATNIASESLVIYEKLEIRHNIRTAMNLIADCMTRSGD